MRRFTPMLMLASLAMLGIATPSSAVDTPITFAIIGDYGTYNAAEQSVASVVAGWSPSFVVSTGDNYYGSTGSGTGKYDLSTGRYYCAFLRDAASGTYCSGAVAATNAFFPVLGNHDYSDAGGGTSANYEAYFTLPGAGLISSTTNERYYDFVQGPVHFFLLNSNAQEPSGITSTSMQAQWLQQQLAASTSPWNIVILHHPPYSSDSTHGSNTTTQWPFAAWGADAVIAGHAHTYERIDVAGTPYIVNGLGGAGRYGFKATPVSGSMVRYNADWGAQLVTASATSLTMEFRNTLNQVIDTVSLSQANASMHVAAVAGSSTVAKKTWSATATVTVHDASHTGLSGVTVSGTWSAGASGSGTCTTGSAGTCSVTKSNLKNGTASVRFTVTAVARSGFTYQSASNEASTVVVSKP